MEVESCEFVELSCTSLPDLFSFFRRLLQKLLLQLRFCSNLRKIGMVLLKGWKFGAFVGSIFGIIGIAIYPIIISPMMDPEPYSMLLSTLH